MEKTVSFYKIRLDDTTCDKEGCDKYSDTIIVYMTDSGQFFHNFSCNEHDKVLPNGSLVFEVEEPLEEDE